MEYLRQSSLFLPSKHAKPVAIIGCGGVGSFTAIALAKLGIKDMELWDDDTVEAHNLPNQFFAVKDSVGGSKSTQLAALCNCFSDDVFIEDYQCKFGEESWLCPGHVVVSGVDSMAQRKIIWKQLKFNPAVDMYIDARLGGQLMRVFTVAPMLPDEVKRYEQTLYTDAEAEKLGCTDRSIIDVGFAVAAVVTRLVRGFLVGEKIPSQVVLSMKDLVLERFD